MKKIIFCLFIFCFIESAIADTSINEIMYNPSGSDNNLEYIEIYSEEFINLSKWHIEDSQSRDDLNPLSYQNNSYSLIVEQEFNYSKINASVYSAGKTIGNNLNNDQDLILLKDNNSNIIDAVSYTNEWGGDNNDKSLCKMPDKIGTWTECISSAGKKNSEDNADCDWTISVVMNSSVSEDPEWQIRANKLDGEKKSNLTIKHWIENAFEETVKEYLNIEVENALNQKTSNKYSPSLTKGQSYFIKANITKASCNDDNAENDFISKMFFIPDKDDVYSLNSSININDISPNSPEFGDTIKIKTNIYRGETRKYAVYAYVEDDEDRVSEKSTIHAKTKFVNYSLTMPVQLKPDCNDRYEEGHYDVVIEGLGTQDKKEIEIEGIVESLCKESSTSSSNSYSGSFEYKIISYPKKIKTGENFDVQLKLENSDDENYDIELWSYIYRGPKCYSASREKNKKHLVLDSKSSQNIILKNKVEKADPGDYKLKVKLRKNNQKTLKELTKTITITQPPISKNFSSQNKESQNRSKLTTWFEVPVYQSTSFRAFKLTPFLIIISLSLSLTILILTKTF